MTHNSNLALWAVVFVNTRRSYVKTEIASNRVSDVLNPHKPLLKIAGTCGGPRCQWR